jgi:hypothetical protein
MSFKYIDPDNVGYTAGDADELTSIDFGNVQPSREYISILRLGNTGSSDATYTITGVTTNSGILSSFELSDDGDDYVEAASGIVISNLPANQISDKLYLKFTIPEDAYISDGTIRLYTVES